MIGTNSSEGKSCENTYMKVSEKFLSNMLIMIMYLFRNVINSVGGFSGEESLSCMLYLLQAMFVEMETHANKYVPFTF